MDVKKKIKFTVKPKAKPPPKKKIKFKVKAQKKDRRYSKETHDIYDYESTKVRPFRKNGKMYYKNLEKHRVGSEGQKHHDFFNAHALPISYNPGYDGSIKVTSRSGRSRKTV